MRFTFICFIFICREVSSILLLIGRAVENLLEGLTVGVQAEPEMLARYRDANLLVLKVGREYSTQTSKISTLRVGKDYMDLNLQDLQVDCEYTVSNLARSPSR